MSAHKLLEANVNTLSDAAVGATVGYPDEEPEPMPEPEPEPEQKPETHCVECLELIADARCAIHGECLLRQTFGPIAEILVPEDVAEGRCDPDFGMSVRSSGFAVECLIDRTTAEQVLHRTGLDKMALSERRIMVAYLRAKICEEYGPLDEVEPQLARTLRGEAAVRDTMRRLIDSLGEIVGDDDDENQPAEPSEARA